MESNSNTTTTTNDNNQGSVVSLENINQMASWVSASVISAFFSSLERFSCVNVSTDDDDDEDEAQDRALTNSNHQSHQESDLPV